MVVSGDRLHRWRIHDRDRIYAEGVDVTLAAMGLTILKTPVRAPQANAFCERLIGSLRRECLDFMIPFSEQHMKRAVQEWVTHYNRGRPHSALGPGFPEPVEADVPDSGHRHKLAAGHRIVKRSVLGGLHREYSLVKSAA